MGLYLFLRVVLLGMLVFALFLNFHRLLFPPPVEMPSIAKLLNTKLRGWIASYGKYSIRSLRNTLMMMDRKLIKWLRKKHKIGYRKSEAKLNSIRQANPELFYHWKMGHG